MYVYYSSQVAISCKREIRMMYIAPLERPPIGLSDGMAEWVEYLSPVWEIGESKPDGFEHWSIQTSDFKIDTSHFLTRRSALLG